MCVKFSCQLSCALLLSDEYGDNGTTFLFLTNNTMSLLYFLIRILAKWKLRNAKVPSSCPVFIPGPPVVPATLITLAFASINELVLATRRNCAASMQSTVSTSWGKILFAWSNVTLLFYSHNSCRLFFSRYICFILAPCNGYSRLQEISQQYRPKSPNPQENSMSKILFVMTALYDVVISSGDIFCFQIIRY